VRVVARRKWVLVIAVFATVGGAVALSATQTSIYSAEAQMLVKTRNKIDGVAAANDGLANAVVSALKAQKLKPIALSGQDATPAGVQNILSGWQTMTVYKKVPAEAAAVAAAAIAVLKGKSVASTGTVPNGKKKEKAILIAPIAITKANYKMLFTDKFLKKSEVCVGEFAKYCK
jgi:D-xylose transport system substrate-binding protein